VKSATLIGEENFSLDNEVNAFGHISFVIDDWLKAADIYRVQIVSPRLGPL